MVVTLVQEIIHNDFRRARLEEVRTKVTAQLLMRLGAAGVPPNDCIFRQQTTFKQIEQAGIRLFLGQVTRGSNDNNRECFLRHKNCDGAAKSETSHRDGITGQTIEMNFDWLTMMGRLSIHPFGRGKVDKRLLFRLER